MANSSLNHYLQQVDTAWNERDGSTIAELLSFKHPHVANSRLQLANPESAVERIVEAPVDEIAAAHLRCIWAANNQDFVEAFRCQSIAVQAFTKIFQSLKDENWALPLMYALCLDLRLLANNADKQLSRKGKGKPGETLEKAAEGLMGCFRVCAADNRTSEEDTKRWGMLNLINQLFKIYFRINKLHLCKPLIRAIESSSLKANFQLSQMVTYRYYVGRKAMFDSDFKEADEFLTFAFERCHRQSRTNKRLILIYLIPVKMLRGYMPNRYVLEKYDLLQYQNVAEAVKKGNLSLLNQALRENKAFFIKSGLYLILEKLRIHTYRNLFKKVYTVMETHQIPIEAFQVALQMAGETDIDSDETQCILANLIYDGKIKGYLSFQHQKLVVSKQNPFPVLTTLN